MEFQFGEDHQQRVFEDHATATFKASSSGQRLTAAETGVVSGSGQSSHFTLAPIDPVPSKKKQREKKRRWMKETNQMMI